MLGDSFSKSTSPAVQLLSAAMQVGGDEDSEVSDLAIWHSDPIRAAITGESYLAVSLAVMLISCSLN